MQDGIYRQIEHTFYSGQMSANPSKRDAWPRPIRTRHVLTAGARHTALPRQGLVLEWRQRGNRWWALVALIDDTYPDARLMVRWLPHEELVPVDWPDINKVDWTKRWR